MVVRSIRLSKNTKQQLSRLKRRTGIPTYNVLCRWALCHSLSQSIGVGVDVTVQNERRDVLLDIQSDDEKELEIDWRVLGGSFCDIFVAVIKQTLVENQMKIDDNIIFDQVKRHIEAGVRQLVANDDIKNIEGLLTLLMDNKPSVADPVN